MLGDLHMTFKTSPPSHNLLSPTEIFFTEERCQISFSEIAYTIMLSGHTHS